MPYITTSYTPNTTSHERFAWEGYPGAGSDPQPGAPSDLEVPGQKITEKREIPIWKKLAAGAAAGLALGGGAAVVNDAFFHSTEVVAPANPAPERAEDNNDSGVETYLKDDNRNERLRDNMTQTTTEILAAIQAGEIKVSSMVDPIGYEPVDMKGDYGGDVVLKGAKNGVIFTLEVYRFPDGKFSFDPRTIKGISLDVVEAKKASDAGAAIAAPNGVVFGNGKEFSSVVVNSGLVELMNNDPTGETTVEISDSTASAASPSEAQELDNKAGHVLNVLSSRLLKG